MLHMLIVKNLTKKTISDKIFKDRAYEIAINPKMDIKKHFQVWFIKFLIKK